MTTSAPTELLLPIATEAEAQALLAQGDTLFDTTNALVRVGDGVTPGGIILGTAQAVARAGTAVLQPMVDAVAGDIARLEGGAALVDPRDYELSDLLDLSVTADGYILSMTADADMESTNPLPLGGYYLDPRDYELADAVELVLSADGYVVTATPINDLVANPVDLGTVGKVDLDPRDYELADAVELSLTIDGWVIDVDAIAPPLVDGGTDVLAAATAKLRAIIDRPAPLVSKLKVVAQGDSFANQDMAAQAAAELAKLLGLASIPSENQGYSSHTSLAAAKLVNALPALYKPMGGFIPADTSSVQLIPYDVALRAGPCQIFGGAGGASANVIFGDLGVFRYDNDTHQPFFARRNAGTAIAMPDFEPLVCIPYDRSILLQTLDDDYRDCIILLSLGRNNIDGRSAAALIAEDNVAVDAMLGIIRPLARSVILTSIWNGNNEPRGDAQYDKVMAMNANRAARYPPFYFDTRSLAVANYDPTNPGDVSDYNRDIPPRSYRTNEDGSEDFLHPRPGGRNGQNFQARSLAGELYRRYFSNFIVD